MYLARFPRVQELIERTVAQAAADGRIRVPRLGALLADKRCAKLLFPLVPLGFRTLAVPPAEILLTSSSAFARLMTTTAAPPSAMRSVKSRTLAAWYSSMLA